MGNLILNMYPSCTYRSVLDLVLAWSGQAFSQITTTQRIQIDGFINQRLRDWAWTAEYWNYTTHTQGRRYRNTYSAATAYAAPTATTASEVYFPASRTYYQALRATTGNAPATGSAGNYVVNAAYWAVCAGPYTGPDWTDNTAYAVGDIVRDIVTGLYKQCFEAHTSSGSIDNTKFGILTTFDPYIARDQSWETLEIGEYLGLYLDDPKVYKLPRRLPYIVDALGAHVQVGSAYDGTYVGSAYWWGNGMGGNVPVDVYVRFREPCPVFRGTAFSALATYAAGDKIYYADGSTGGAFEGDYWECLEATTAGQDPADTPAKWEKIPFPLWLQNAVARKAFADWLRYGGQREDAQVEDAAAEEELFDEQLRQTSQQGQVKRWRKTA